MASRSLLATLSRVVVAALSLTFAACGSTPDPADWLVNFAGGAAPAGTVSVHTEIRAGGCSGAAIYKDDVSMGERVGMSPNPLAEGTYGFYAEAREASCRVLASACVTVTVPVTGTVTVTLNPGGGTPMCTPAMCSAGVCQNMGLDLGVDLGPPDLGPPPDFGMMECTGEGTPCGVAPDDGLCRGGNCCPGCWNGTACRLGTADAECGAAGAMCTSCTPTGTCVAATGMCMMTPGTVVPQPLALSPVGSLLLLPSGVFASAGSDTSLQRGQPRASSPSGWSFEAYTGPTRFVAVAATQFTGHGLTAAGHLFSWGTNRNGLLGLGTGTTTSTQPMPTIRVGMEVWRTIDGGNAHVCAISQAGRLACWGDRTDGRVGIGANTGIQTSPIFVDAGTTWASVSAGDRHTCATKSDGTLWCWGYNGGATEMSGQLGVGDSTSRDTPAPVAGADWRDVSAGNAHTCAIKTDGTLWCWGEASFWGRLGLGSTDPGATGDVRTPMQVTTPALSWATVAAGQFHTCAIAVGGELYCWGTGVKGATGIGTNGATFEPTSIGVTYRAVATGYTHTCGQQTDSTVLCWGEASKGTGTGVDPEPTVYLLSPTPVVIAM